MNCHMLKYKTEKMIKYSHILKTSFAITDYISTFSCIEFTLYFTSIVSVEQLWVAQCRPPSSPHYGP